MKTYRVAVNQKEYDKLEKMARMMGTNINMIAKMLLQEARIYQEENCKFAIYIPLRQENEKRDIPLFLRVNDEFDDYLLKIAGMAKGLKPGKIAQLYLIDILDRKED